MQAYVPDGIFLMFSSEARTGLGVSRVLMTSRRLYRCISTPADH
jgi:hypothetical protein